MRQAQLERAVHYLLDFIHNITGHVRNYLLSLDLDGFLVPSVY